MVRIEGQKVVLREKRIEDAQADYSWRTDPELARLDATVPLTMTYDQFLRFSREELQYPSPWSRRFGIETFAGRHIGNCMIYDIDLKKGDAELGIVVGDRDYLSKGFGSDAVLTVLDHVWSTTTLNRVYLHTLVWNERARKSFAKCGFREVKQVHRGGLDFMLMEITREEAQRLSRVGREAARRSAAAAETDEGSARS